MHTPLPCKCTCNKNGTSGFVTRQSHDRAGNTFDTVSRFLDFDFGCLENEVDGESRVVTVERGIPDSSEDVLAFASSFGMPTSLEVVGVALTLSSPVSAFSVVGAVSSLALDSCCKINK